MALRMLNSSFATTWQKYVTSSKSAMLDDMQIINLQANMVSSSDTLVFSEYFYTLDGPTRERYKQKANLVGFDPFDLRKSDLSEDLGLIPGVEYPDIVNYLILQTSWATNSEMKAYKSLDAFNFFISGWVNTLMMKEVTETTVVVLTRVS